MSGDHRRESCVASARQQLAVGPADHRRESCVVSARQQLAVCTAYEMTLDCFICDRFSFFTELQSSAIKGHF